MGNRSKSSNAIELLTKRKMVRFFGGGGSDGLGRQSDEKSRLGFFGSVLGKFDEGRRSESDLTRKSKVKPWRTLVAGSVTRLGDLLHFGQLFKASVNNYFAQIAYIFRQFL